MCCRWTKADMSSCGGLWRDVPPRGCCRLCMFDGGSTSRTSARDSSCRMVIMPLFTLPTAAWCTTSLASTRT